MVPAPPVGGPRLRTGEPQRGEPSRHGGDAMTARGPDGRDPTAVAATTREVYEAGAAEFDTGRSRSLFERGWLDRFLALVPAGRAGARPRLRRGRAHRRASDGKGPPGDRGRLLGRDARHRPWAVATRRLARERHADARSARAVRRDRRVGQLLPSHRRRAARGVAPDRGPSRAGRGSPAHRRAGRLGQRGRGGRSTGAPCEPGPVRLCRDPGGGGPAGPGLRRRGPGLRLPFGPSGPTQGRGRR